MLHPALTLLTGVIVQCAAEADRKLQVTETPVGTADSVVIETVTPSPDGRRLAYAARDGDKLVLTVDGKPASKPYDGFALNGIAFSPDSKRVAAMVSPTADKWLLLVDGEEGEAYDVFVKDSLTFSPDSGHVAVVAGRGNKRMAVVDGVAGKPYDDVKAFAFAPAGGEKGRPRYAYAARELANWTIVTDTGETGTSYTAIGDGPVLFGPDGKRHLFVAAKDWLSFARPTNRPREPVTGWSIEGLDSGGGDEVPPAGVRFSPDGGKVAHLGRVGEWWLAFVDGQEQPGEYTAVVPESLAWRADGSIVFAGRTPEGWAVIDAGKAGPAFDEIVFPPVLSADREHVVYVGSRGGRHVVVVDGKEDPPVEQVLEPPVVGARGRVAYAARRGQSQFVVLDGKEGPALDVVGRLAFSPDGKHLAYGAQRGGESVIRIGGRETPAFTGFLPRSRLVFEDDATLHAQTFRGQELLQVTVRLPATDEGRERR